MAPPSQRAKPAIRLGPFDLIEPVGQGGMGQVWRGTQRTDGLPVAVKLLTGRPNAITGAAFRREVRAVAGLDHPHVVLVLDCGEVSRAEARGAGGQLGLGAPWIAMEYADGGSISVRRGQLTWWELRGILIALLDALAHAHARGVVHRDIKPANVLLGGLRPGLKLTDFGIAHLRDPGDDEERATPIGGTPSYMAPEQIDGRWRDYGPWTDLYSLGATAWALATGWPPFRVKGFAANARAHLSTPPPALRSTGPVPDGFEGWLRRLLAKDPQDRYRRAADAAWALEQLGEAEGPGRDGTSDPDAATELRPPLAAAGRRTTLLWAESSSSELVAPAWTRSEVGPGAHRVVPADRPPLPRRWERERSAPRVRASLGLFGLRQVPLVGRRAERDALWSALREVAAGRPRAVLLSGAAGCGKSRLAEWLCERAHELGAAEVTTAFHGPDGGPGDGVVPALARALRCAGLPRAEVRARLGRVLPPLGIEGEDVDAVTELLAPASPQERDGGLRAPRVSDDERRALVTRLVSSLAVERPLVLWADDVQWGARTVELARALLDRGDPVLIVATVQEDALGDDPFATERIRALAAHPRVTAIDVRPLPAPATGELLATWLGLDDDLAHRVQRRVAGNPLFALQLVGDWVARGELVPTDDGFRLREGGSPDLPDTVHRVWDARIARVCEGLGPDALPVLVLAACLGQEVDRAEWTDAAAHGGLAVPEGLVDRLLDHRLWRTIPGGAGWVFSHGMLRESLLRTVDGARLHIACAQMLAGRGGAGVAARLGRHRLAAGDAAQAIEALGDASARASSDGDLREAEELVGLLLLALDAAGVGGSDDRRGVAIARLAEVARARGDFGRARRLAEEVLAGPDSPGRAVTRCKARGVLAFLAMKAGDIEAAIAGLEAAVRDYDALGEPGLAARARVTLAIALQFAGDLDRADQVVAQATRRTASMSDRVASAEAHRMRAAIALQRGRLPEAELHFRDARALYEDGGHRTGRSLAEAGLGDVARFRGELEAAERWYRSAMEGLEAAGAMIVVSVRASLALVRMDQGAFPEARGILEEGVRRLERAGSFLEARDLFRFLALPCYAAEGDWAAFDAVFDDDARPVVDADVARAFDLSATLAADRGETTRSARVSRLAAEQWRKLGGRP